MKKFKFNLLSEERMLKTWYYLLKKLKIFGLKSIKRSPLNKLKLSGSI